MEGRKDRTPLYNRGGRTIGRLVDGLNPLSPYTYPNIRTPYNGDTVTVNNMKGGEW